MQVMIRARRMGVVPADDLELSIYCFCSVHCDVM